jgi:hypothetical protein
VTCGSEVTPQARYDRLHPVASIRYT